MVRTILITLGFLAAAASPAVAQPSSTAPVGMEVRSDDGQLMGRVTGVMRDENGRVIGVDMAGLEPASAPRAQSRAAPSSPLVASIRAVRDGREARYIRREDSVRLASNR